jgi:integrase
MPLKLYRRGSKVWHYRGTVAGRRLRGSTKTASKEVAGRIVSDKEQVIWKGHLDGPGATLTFAQAAMMYRQAGKSDRFLREVEDHWKDTLVPLITPGAIRSAAIVLYPTAGPATRNRQVIVPTQAVINHAADHELCPPIRVKRFPVVKKEKTPATWEWVQSFMEHAVKPNLAALACFMFLTGARITEAVSVRWEDVDFKKRKVLIRSTKIGLERWAHMPTELIAALARITDREELVFSFKSRGNCKTQWSGAIRRAGIAPLSYHACRHGFATGLLDKGVNPKTVAERGGWKNVQHVFATYGHDVASDDVTDLLTGADLTRDTKKVSNVR